MAMDDREQQFERALARLLREASPESRCADAETLSAYHERSLPEAEMIRWKEHISECVHCQEILALVEQSEEVQAEEWDKQEEPAEVYAETLPALPGGDTPSQLQPASRFAAAGTTVTPIPEKPSRARWHWLIPVGALAACAIVAVGIREVQVQHQKEAQKSLQMAMTRSQEPTQQATAPFSASPAQQSMQQLNQQQRQAPALDNTAGDQKHSGALPPPSGAVASSHAAAAPPNEPVLTPRREAVPNPAARMAAPVAPEASDLTAAEIDRDTEARKVPAPAPSPAAGAAKKAEKDKPAPPPPSPETVTVELQSSPPPADSRLADGELKRVMTANVLEAAAADRRYIVAPGVKSVWRVGDAGKIERSTDRGKTWQQESSGVTTDLTAGLATSDNVCWVTGKSGTILLSVDGGKSWKQVASPIAGDLGGIHAADALHASVWDVPNHVSYETSDGGATWSRIANE